MFPTGGKKEKLDTIRKLTPYRYHKKDTKDHLKITTNRLEITLNTYDGKWIKLRLIDVAVV